MYIFEEKHQFLANAVLCSIFNAPMELLEQVILVPMLFIEQYLLPLLCHSF